MQFQTLAQPCAIHGTHTPVNLTIEWHHVIPVAWQLCTSAPSPPPSPGPDTDGRGMLWDDRGVWLCPTGHRNVHRWITTMMHAQAAANTSDPAAALKAISGTTPATPEMLTAADALIRYTTETGASLLYLTARNEWGQV